MMDGYECPVWMDQFRADQTRAAFVLGIVVQRRRDNERIERLASTWHSARKFQICFRTLGMDQSNDESAGRPIALQAFLFTGAIVWEMLCAILFFMACARFRNRTLLEEKESLWACVVAFAFWCTFQVLDEVFLAYDPESVHRVIFIETILTMIFLQWMPRENTA